MLNSKIGIVVNFDESEENQMFPVIRAIECAKEKFDVGGDPKYLIQVMNKLESITITDPKKINSGGLVELEKFLE